MPLQYFQHESPANVILVHGAGETNLLWKDVVAPLKGKGSALALNLPGHPLGQITCKSVEEYCEKVREFMLEQGIEQAVVCGHSMGGAIALNLALSHHEIVSGLILMNTGAKLGVSATILNGLSFDPLRTINEVILPMSLHSKDQATVAKLKDLLSLSNVDIFLNDYSACNAFDVRDRLGEITCRTLVVYGEMDLMTPAKWATFMNDNIKGSSMRMVPKTGHYSQIEDPSTCSKLIAGFLQTT